MDMMRGVWCAVGLMLAGVAFAVPGVNVRDFGAVGDGIADDTLAIQRAADALDAARDNGRKHMMVLCDRYRKSRMDGPVGEVFFPKGTYRTTGPVVFRGSTFVRGEKGTVVRNDNPRSVVFFFRKGYRTDVRDITVEGGGVQVHVWTSNMESSTIALENAVFRNASDTSFLTDGFRKDPKAIDPTRDYHSPSNYHSNIVYVSPYEESVASNGLWTLRPRDMTGIITCWNSTLCTIRNCRFEDAEQAFRGWTDGIVIADCHLRGNATSTNSLIRAGGVCRIIRCRLEPGANMSAAVEVQGNNVMLTSSTVSLKGKTVVARSEIVPFSWLTGMITTLTDVGIEGAGNPVFLFPAGKMAAMNSAYGVTSLDGGHHKLFAFEHEPTREEAEALVVGAKARPGLPLENSVSFAVKSVDTEIFDISLPAALECCRAEIPNRVLARRKMRPSALTFPERVFSDDAIGDEMYYADTGKDDTERVRALVAKAAAAGGGTVLLPSRWIRLTGAVELPDNVEVTCRGRAVLTMLNDADAFFRAKDGVRARLVNLVFHRGRHALVAEGLKGLIQLKNCYYYEQLEESVVDETDGDNRFRVEVVGGVANTARMYRGNANPVLFDGFWSTIRSGHAREEWQEDYIGYANKRGGWLEMYDILAVPNVFEHFDKTMSPRPGNPAKGTVRGRWVDNSGVFRSFAFRGGGEQGGLTLVYHHGADAVTYVENHNCSTRNKRLKGGMAQIVSDVESPKITIANLVSYNFTERPPVFVSRLDEGEAWHLVDARVVNCFPFVK